MGFIKCRTKKLAKEGAEKILKLNIHCYAEGYNIIGFSSIEESKKATKILKGI